MYLLPLVFIVSCAATEYWVRPDSTTNCNAIEPCVTLSDCVQNTSHYFTSNSVLHFLSGNHTISETTWVIVRYTENISLVGVGSPATFQCNGRLSFTFEGVLALHISNIHFVKCGLEIMQDYFRSLFTKHWRLDAYKYKVVHIQVALLFVDSSVMLENVEVMESYGYGLLGYNVMMAKLNHCLFHHNYWRTRVESDSRSESNIIESKAGGNAHFKFQFLSQSTIRTLNILHSEFAYGRNQYESLDLRSDLALVHGGGLGIEIGILLNRLAIEAYNFTIDNCSMHNNIAPVGANMFLSVDMKHSREISIHINNCKFFGGRSTSKGGGLMLLIENGGLTLYSGRSVKVYLTNLEVYDNSAINGSGLYLGVRSVDYKFECQKPRCMIELFNSTFIHNAGGTAVYISTLHDPRKLSFKMTLISNLFERNFMLVGRKFDCAVVYLSCVKRTTIANSTFSDNNCTSVAAKSSTFYMGGSVVFYRNTGYSGGAIAFHRDAPCEITERTVRVRSPRFMILTPHTSVYIVNNTAVRYGGGILDGECIAGCYCFFDKPSNLNYTQMGARVVMEGNRAGKAGDSIFGGCLNSCYQTLLLPTRRQLLTAKTFSSLFQIHGQTESEVATSPHKICFCDTDKFEGSVGYTYHCLSETSTVHFRGEIFHVLAMIVGEYGYASPGIVRTMIAPGNSGELEEQQSIQELGKMCANLTYTVRSSQESIRLYLSVESLTDNEMPLAILNISFRPCPLGFNLSDSPPKCDCALQLRKPGVKCHINTQLIHRPATLWIGNYSDEVVVHTNCPFDYCKPKGNEISLYAQNQQCAFNRSGVLCGACQPGLSLALGTSQCMHCSNIYILLFILFALAGVALITCSHAEMQPHCVHKKSQWPHLLCQHHKGKSCCLLPSWRITGFQLIPECVHSLAELRSGNGSVPLSKHECVHQDMVAVCISGLYLDLSWTYDMFQ